MKNLAYIIVCLFLLNSCNKKEDEPMPSGCIGQVFTYTSPFEVNTSSINFTKNNDLIITAGFSNSMLWTVTIKGRISKAIRTYSGQGNSINISWDGRPNSNSRNYLFEEDIDVKLEIPCAVPKVKFVHMINSWTNGTLGTLLGDFDGHGIREESFTLPGYNSLGWSSYYSSPNLLSNFEMVSSPLLAPQGSKYMTIKGQAGPSSYFAGGFYCDFPLISSPPDKTFFNLYLSGNSNTTLAITIINQGSKYTSLVPITWSGWKLVSIRCSDFRNGGNSLSNFTSASAIDFGLNTMDTPGLTVEANMDLLMFTENAPL